MARTFPRLSHRLLLECSALLPALLGAPVFWAAFGALVRRNRKSALGVVLVHYITAVWLVTGGAFGDWEYLRKVQDFAPWLIPLWAATYIGGQGVVWCTLVRRAA